MVDGEARSAAHGRLTFKENVVMRLIGLFIFLAPNKGAEFFADVSVKAVAKAAKLRKERSLAA